MVKLRLVRFWLIDKLSKSSNIQRKMEMQNKEKRSYRTPSIEVVRLDNEISLALESTPPIGPDEEARLMIPEHYNNNPFV